MRAPIEESRRDEEANLSRLPILVGRDEEDSLLRQRWEQSKAGLGQAVLLSGEAGLGKAYEGRNVEAFIDERKIKQLFKEALVEVIEERKEVFYELLTEVLEDIALVRAIQEGEDAEPVSKDEVLKILEDAV